jgi:hypothetical protein
MENVNISELILMLFVISIFAIVLTVFVWVVWATISAYKHPLVQDDEEDYQPKNYTNLSDTKLPANPDLINDLQYSSLSCNIYHTGIDH